MVHVECNFKIFINEIEVTLEEKTKEWKVWNIWNITKFIIK